MSKPRRGERIVLRWRPHISLGPGVAPGSVQDLTPKTQPHPISRLTLDIQFIPEPTKPHHIRFPAKPRHLPLGIIAMRLLRRLYRLLARDFAGQELHRL